MPLMMDMDGLLTTMLVGLHDRRILMTSDLNMLKRISCQSIFDMFLDGIFASCALLTYTADLLIEIREVFMRIL